MNLTDSEQCRLLKELYGTTIGALKALKQSGIDRDIKAILDGMTVVTQEVKKTSSIARTWANMLKFGAKDLRE